MKRKSKRKHHMVILSDLLLYGWQVEACYVRGSPGWCSASVDPDGRHVFYCGKTTRTPPFLDAGDRLTFVVTPHGQNNPNKLGYVIRTWDGLRRFVGNEQEKWVIAKIKAGHFGETARQNFERAMQ